MCGTLQLKKVFFISKRLLLMTRISTLVQQIWVSMQWQTALNGAFTGNSPDIALSLVNYLKELKNSNLFLKLVWGGLKVSQCNPYCTPVQPLPDGWHGECPNCVFPMVQQELWTIVPRTTSNKGGVSVDSCQKEEQSLVLELKTPKRFEWFGPSHTFGRRRNGNYHISSNWLDWNHPLKISCGKIDLTLSEINSTSLVCLYHHS